MDTQKCKIQSNWDGWSERTKQGGSKAIAMAFALLFTLGFASWDASDTKDLLALTVPPSFYKMIRNDHVQKEPKELIHFPIASESLSEPQGESR